jgi:hypothetical protein
MLLHHHINKTFISSAVCEIFDQSGCCGRQTEDGDADTEKCLEDVSLPHACRLEGPSSSREFIQERSFLAKLWLIIGLLALMVQEP